MFAPGARPSIDIQPLVIKSIGVGLEHTDADKEVLSTAVSLARQHHAGLTLLHIVDTPGTMVFGESSRSLHSAEDEEYLLEVARQIEGPDLPVHTMLRYGNPVEGIIRAVEEGGFDLLVLGSHGHRGLADLVYGETASSVRHGVEIPVLTVRTAFRGHERAQK